MAGKHRRGAEPDQSVAGSDSPGSDTSGKDTVGSDTAGAVIADPGIEDVAGSDSDALESKPAEVPSLSLLPTAPVPSASLLSGAVVVFHDVNDPYATLEATARRDLAVTYLRGGRCAEARQALDAARRLKQAASG